jgi:hypothetical protein
MQMQVMRTLQATFQRVDVVIRKFSPFFGTLQVLDIGMSAGIESRCFDVESQRLNRLIDISFGKSWDSIS